MTSMLSIVLGAFVATRPLAVLLTNDLAAFDAAVAADEDGAQSIEARKDSVASRSN